MARAFCFWWCFPRVSDEAIKLLGRALGREVCGPPERPQAVVLALPKAGVAPSFRPVRSALFGAGASMQVLLSWVDGLFVEEELGGSSPPNRTNQHTLHVGTR